MSAGTLVLGLINGLIIGLLAVGFVLVYKANRFLNLAHAQLGAVSALLLAKVVNDWHWGFWPSFLGCMTVGDSDRASGRDGSSFRWCGERSKSPVRLMMLTIGVGDVLLALTFIPGLTPTSQAPYPQPFSSHLEVGGVVLSGMAVLTLIAVPLLLVMLTVFLEFTSLGKQVRAAASNPDAARLCGISVNRVSLIIWGLAGGLSAISAILSGPTTTTFNAEAAGPYLLMLTMGAAAIGAFVSIPAAVGGGVALGLIYQIVLRRDDKRRYGRAGRVRGDPSGHLGERPSHRQGLHHRRRGRTRTARRPNTGFVTGSPLASDGLLAASMAVVVVVAALFPVLPYFSQPGNQFLLLLVLIYALIGVALTMLVGWAGQVSLGSFAVVGIGAFLAARWAGHAGWNVVDMVIVTGLVGAAVSVVIGLPALRVRGVTLAVVTLGFAVIAPDWLFQQQWLAGSTPFTTVVSPTVVIPGIGHLDSPLDLYYVVLVMLIVVIAAGRSLRRSAAGRVIIAVRDNERASSAFGIRPGTVKLRVFALTGFIAASAGVFWALAWQSISPAQFPADASIAVLALPVVGRNRVVRWSRGGRRVALHGHVLRRTTRERTLRILGTERRLPTPHRRPRCGRIHDRLSQRDRRSRARAVSGLRESTRGKAGVPLQRRPQAQAFLWMAERIRPVPPCYLRPLSFAPHSERFRLTAGHRMRRHGVEEVASTTPLEVEGVAVHFGGITALDGASAKVDPGEIVGLIGPNGAGKTTLMNVISGFLRPDSGSVRLFGTEVASLPPEVRAELGVARSFQDATLFPGLTVLETVQIALGHRSQAASSARHGRGSLGPLGRK